jgi:hypothetical protein
VVSSSEAALEVDELEAVDVLAAESTAPAPPPAPPP